MSTTPVSTLLRHVRQIAANPADHQASDRELLERFLERREEDAFTTLVHRHGPMVLDVCRGVVRDCHRAEDAFQATFLLLAQKAHAIRQRDSIGSWLHGVARHVALKAATAAARRQTLEGNAAVRTPGDPGLDISVRELQNALHQELQKLPEKYRAPLVHCFLEGKTRDQAARQLGWTKGAVRGRLNRGRELLRRRLTRRGLALSAGLVTTAAWAARGTAPAFAGPLARQTTRAALALLAGKASESVSKEVASLVRSAASGLAWNKLKITLAMLLTLGVLGLGAAGVAYSALRVKTESTPEQPLPADPAAARKPDLAEPGPVDLHGDPLPTGAKVRLGTTQLRHSEGVHCVAFSPDGKTVASGAEQRIRLWDRATGKELRSFPREGQVDSLAFSSDGRLLASSGGDVQVWEVATGKKIYTFTCETVSKVQGGTSRLASAPVQFSPDGKRLASVNKDFAVLIWDLTTGKELTRLSGHDSPIHSLRFLSNGKALVSASGERARDGSIRIWDLGTGKTTSTVALSAKPFLTSRVFSFSPDGATLAREALEEVREKNGGVTTFYLAHCIHLRDTATGKERLRLPGKNSVVVSAVFSPDGSRLASATRDDQVTVWDLGTGKAVQQLQQAPGGSTGGTYALAFSKDGKTLASSAEGGALHLWDLTSGRELLDRPAHGGAVNAVAYLPDGRAIATASGDHSIRLWEAASGKPLAVLRGHERNVQALAVSPDGRHLASAGGDGTVRLWDTATYREIHKIALDDIKLKSGGSLTVSRSLTFTPDSQALIAAGSDLQFHHWDVATGKELRQRPWHLSGSGKPAADEEEQVFDVARVQFSADGKTAAVTSRQELHFVDVASGQEFAKLDRKVSQESLAFAGDGRTLVSGGWDKAVRLWEVASGKLIRTIAVPDYVNAVAFSPDGRHVAAGCGWLNATIRVHEVASGKEVLVLEGMGSYIGTLQFSPDGSRLASGQRDTTALLWDLSPIIRNTDRKPTSLAPAALKKLWADLHSEDAAQAHQVLWALVAAPSSTTTYLKDRLPPVPRVTEEKLRRLIADLDAAAFEKREEASKELLQLGSDAGPALRQALAGSLSAEARRRIEALMENPSRLPPSAEQLRRLRAIAALEQIGSAEALAILRDLTQGAPAAAETQEARAALERWAKRHVSQP